MTDRRQAARRQTGGGRGLLLVAALVLAAGIVKYADTPLLAAVRTRAATALSGAPGMGEVLAVFGGAALPDRAADDDLPVYAPSSGGADDIIGREQTLFPDTVDQTVYPLSFAHALPADGTLTSSFGSRLSPTTGQPGFHYGLDIAADEGAPIAAFAAGTVRETGDSSSYGRYLVIDHADGFATLYAHCSRIDVQAGAPVGCGDTVAAVGQTGNATGPHLHLELWKDGAALDPSAYLTEL